MVSLLEEHPVTGRRRGFAPTLARVCEALDGSRIEWALRGATAMSAHGFERYSADFYALVLIDDASAAVDALRSGGFSLPAYDQDTYLYAARDRVTGVDVDLLVGVESLYMDALTKAKRRTLLGLRPPVISPEFVVLFKLRAATDSPYRRHRDFADAVDFCREVRVKLDEVRRYASVHAPDLLPMMQGLRKALVAKPTVYSPKGKSRRTPK
jgi:hypothetical protein